MDSNVTAHVGNLAPRVNMWSEKKIGRPRSDYRAARRNAAKAARKLPEWRESNAEAANERADINARAVVANGAREAAAKALIDENVRQTGQRRDTIALSAMLEYYRGCKRTRPVNRIVRELERQIGA